jgi:hypothetical protein
LQGVGFRGQFQWVFSLSFVGWWNLSPLVHVWEDHPHTLGWKATSFCQGTRSCSQGHEMMPESSTNKIWDYNKPW